MYVCGLVSLECALIVCSPASNKRVTDSTYWLSGQRRAQILQGAMGVMPQRPIKSTGCAERASGSEEGRTYAGKSRS